VLCPTIVQPQNNFLQEIRGCLVNDCEEIHHSLGYCAKHAQRFRRYGDPLFVKPRTGGRKVTDYVAHFLSFCDKQAEVTSDRVTTPCWLWTGSKFTDAGTYPRIYIQRKGVRAHRFSYEIFIGPIPEGMTIDHLCRKTMCVNPLHLEVVTQSENSKRMHEAKYIEETRGDDYINF
jgi:hypothetical protein